VPHFNARLAGCQYRHTWYISVAEIRPIGVSSTTFT